NARNASSQYSPTDSPPCAFAHWPGFAPCTGCRFLATDRHTLQRIAPIALQCNLFVPRFGTGVTPQPLPTELARWKPCFLTRVSVAARSAPHLPPGIYLSTATLDQPMPA